MLVFGKVCAGLFPGGKVIGNDGNDDKSLAIPHSEKQTANDNVMVMKGDVVNGLNN